MSDEPDHVDVYVGQRIRLRRKSLGLSQTALADALGVSFQQVQKYERGANRVSASVLFRVAQKLDVKIGHFFAGLEGQSEGDGSSVADLDAMAAIQAVPELSIIPKLPRDHQRALSGVLAAMALAH